MSRDWRGWRACLAAVSLLGPPSALADEEGGAPVYETVVVGARGEADLEEIPWSVSVREVNELADGQPETSLAEVAATIPGVALQNRENHAQGLRLSIRGFGARSAFGVRGVHVTVDGVPLTTADGQTQLDGLSLHSLRRIEVLRGPAGSLYGNAAGGVVRLETADGSGAPMLEATSTVGQFGLVNSAVSGQTRGDRWHGRLEASHLVTDGHREHMDASETAGHASFTIELPRRLTLRTTAHALHVPWAQDPGGLTEEQARENPSQAGPGNLLFDTGETIDQGRLAFLLEGDPGEHQSVSVTLWALVRGYQGRIPVRAISLDRIVLGLASRWSLDGAFGSLPNRLSVGTEAQAQRDDRQNFTNDEGTVTSERLLDQRERVVAIGLWAQDALHVTPWLTLVAGARVDRVSFDIRDELDSDGDQSGDRAFDALTGSGGLVVSPHTAVQIFANVAQSFETPTTTELVNRPDGTGGLNPDIDPTRTLGAELGARLLPDAPVSADAALFWMRLTDELVPFEDATGRTLYRNAGRSHRVGAELGVSVEPLPGWQILASLSWLRARFDELTIDGESFADKAVPGIRPWRGGLETHWRLPANLFVAGTMELASATWADDANTARATGFARLGLRAGWKARVDSLALEVSAGADNILDERFADNLRVNAFGGRYFEPAPGRHGWLTFSLAWLPEG